MRLDSGDISHWSDDWNGFPAARERLLRQVHDSGLANPVVLGGDIHSFWANAFRNFGVATTTQPEGPTAANLKPANIYIIVDPDTKEENEHPNFIEPQHIKAITDWVKGLAAIPGRDFTLENVQDYIIRHSARPETLDRLWEGVIARHRAWEAAGEG